MDAREKPLRRAMLKRDAACLTVMVLMPMFAGRQTARAGSASKEDFYYQDHPKDGKNCATCAAFSPDGAGTGSCKIIAGSVAPNGWCMAWSRRN